MSEKKEREKKRRKGEKVKRNGMGCKRVFKNVIQEKIQAKKRVQQGQKTTCHEGEKSYFRKKGGGDKYHFLIKYRPLGEVKKREKNSKTGQKQCKTHNFNYYLPMRKIEERGESGQIWSLKNKQKNEGGRGAKPGFENMARRYVVSGCLYLTMFGCWRPLSISASSLKRLRSPLLSFWSWSSHQATATPVSVSRPETGGAQHRKSKHEIGNLAKF